MGCVFGGLRKLLSLCVKVSIIAGESRIVGDKKKKAGEPLWR